ncbi:alcohol dehydrogenase family protein [Ancylomarina sp. 16SWW S1-10-2]|uniref:alcohol dehydrogenase family protein n=1 Tax=Ancylomarina sp. 16SWW S1-10-2 TaxID=2499681 RepID=UPI0012AD907A|nr:alcohol dehydrogenase family protein [Ancylomarina sp. 16SWW S1-10-2]MRT93642.1 NAD-dependent epimerase/dehydratase family protein [Ancylomarina sp. 16SWW S1-10-2]
MNKIPKIMRGVYLKGHGDFDMLELRNDIPVPKPGPNEVLIKVGAAAVNNTDINTRKAWYSKGNGDSDDASWSGNPMKFPRIQGADVCGRIVSIGEHVNTQRLNERVLIEPCIREFNGEILTQAWYFGSECDGGFAEYTVVSSIHAYAIKSDLSDVELASFPCSYSTAENMLSRSKVLKGETVLITGASGGVGSAAVQLAKARGAKVIGITSKAKVEKVLQIGADKVLMRDDNIIQKLGENSIDVVIDLVGGKQWPDLINALKPSGRYAVAGAIGDPHVKLDIRTLYLKDLTFFGCTVLNENVFSNLIMHIENKNISPLVSASYPLEDIVKAQQSFLDKQHIGKIVLKIN